MTAVKVFVAVLAALVVFSLLGLVIALSAVGGEARIHTRTVITEMAP